MLTITEALAEIKTIGKRIEKKREFVRTYLVRQEIVRDPLENQGGSKAAIAAEFQGIRDLEDRVVTLRRLIAKANADTTITIGGATRSIQDWLTWRREVANGRREMLTTLRRAIQDFRTSQTAKGFTIRTEPTTDPTDKDLIVNLDERALAQDAEALETVLGTLDGLLSLKNATITIEA